MLNRFKNKYESQQISKKFKNKHRRNRLNPKSCIKRKWTKEAQSWCKKCQIKNCKYGTKKELRRLKKLHFKDCDCKLTFKQYDQVDEYKKYPNIIIDQQEVFDALKAETPDSCFDDICTVIHYSSDFWTIFEKYQNSDIYDFEEEYYWKHIECKQKKNKYLSQKIAKKFKNKHKDHKYKKYITRRQRKRMYSSTVDAKLKKTKFKISKNKRKYSKRKKYTIYNIKKDIYDYQELYDKLDNMEEFKYTDGVEEQYEDEKIKHCKANYNAIYDELPLESCSNSTSLLYNAILPLQYILSKTPYYNLFGGYVTCKYKNGGFIMFDAIDNKAKYWWKKTIYFRKKDCDISYDNICKNERVVFSLKLKYLSGSTRGCEVRTIKIRRPKNIGSISNNHAYLLISGYFSTYFQRNDKYLPMDIQQIIMRYYIKRRYHDENSNRTMDYKIKENVIKYTKTNSRKRSNYTKYGYRINNDKEKRLSPYSSIRIYNKSFPLKYIINKLPYYDEFAGYIQNKANNGGIIIFDDIDINAKYWWKKTIYFHKKDCDIHYDNLCENERVLFKIKIDKSFIHRTLCWYKLRAINIKHAKLIDFISNDNIDLLISGYFSTYFNRNDKYLPTDIQLIIICYYIQHTEDKWRYNICSRDYCIKNNYIVHHKNPASTHNIIISRIGLKRNLNDTHFFCKVLKTATSGYFGVGIISHPQKVINYLCQYNNQRPWYLNSLHKFRKQCAKYKWHYKATNYFAFTDKLNVENGDLFYLNINFNGTSCSMKLYKNCNMIKEKHFDTDDELYFPFIAFGNGITSNDNSVEIKLYKNITETGGGYSS